MNPPLRSEDDRQALIDGLRSGALDCIATDHAPHSREEKEEPFELAPMGVTGLETAFAALHTGLVVPGVLDLGLVVERMTAGGEPFGLSRAAARPRARAADVCLVDLARSGRWGRPATRAARPTAPSPAGGCTGRVRMTVAAGAVAFRERSFAIGAVA